MKLLFISNIAGRQIGNFTIPSIIAAKKLNIEFHFAANFSNTTSEQLQIDENKYGIKCHHIDFDRSPIRLSVFQSYKNLKRLIEKENFDIIHCNTPIGGLLGRICSKKCRINKVLYTAHGFHFYKGKNKILNIIYKWIEKSLAKQTDGIITMNKEDYAAAQKFKLRNNGKCYFIHGVGIKTNIDSVALMRENSIRIEFGFSNQDIICISLGGLVKNKNYETSIRAIADLKDSRVKYLICGKGPLLSQLETLVLGLGLEDQVFFLGHRSDSTELLNESNIFLFSTYQEGLSRALMESMAMELPCVVSNIRGNNDLINNGEGGYLCNPHNYKEFSKALNLLIHDEDLRRTQGQRNKDVIKIYDEENVKKEMQEIYVEMFS